MLFKILVPLLLGPLMAFAQEPSPHGTDPHRLYLPKRAIDTEEIPNIPLKASDPPDAPLPYYKIASDTYMLFGNIAEVDPYNRGFNGNAGFVVTERGVVVIDALGTPKLGSRLIATIRQVTDQPIRFLILTHNHPDHSYGAIAFRRAGAVVIAHRGTLDYLRSTRFERSVAFRRDIIPKDMEGFEGVVPDILVDGPLYSKVTLKAGKRTFDIYNTGPHHSFGDLVIHQVEDGIVWISDLAFNQRVTFMGDGNSKLAIQGQNWLLEHFKDARLMVPGHGSAQTPPFPMVEKTRAYMQRLRDFMARAIEEGLDLQDAVEASVEAFSDWKGVRLFDLNHRANANFVYREMEEALF
ncbi:MAG: MBL fold metallo-hydrolase [Gammaproteobacteria bacterium]|nr:MAG: MBL fold metallo-hydrolase [Gammaproteobacteria bacterium]